MKPKRNQAVTVIVTSLQRGNNLTQNRRNGFSVSEVSRWNGSRTKLTWR